MPRPSSLPPASHYPHGTRARYVSGCHCTACRFANVRAYHDHEKRALEAAAQLRHQRPVNGVPRTWLAPDGTRKARVFKNGCPGVKGEPCPWGSYLRKDSSSGICARCRVRLVWNGTVDVGKSLAHIRKLSRQGVGYKSIAAASGVSHTILHEIMACRKKTIRATTEKRILAVDKGARANGALISAGPSKKLLNLLLARGFTKTELARRLGSKSKQPALQFKRRKILAVTAYRIAKLFRNIGNPPPRRSRWGVVICDCIRPLPFERNGAGWCGRCEKPARPEGMTRAAFAREPERRASINQAFGYDGGWGWEHKKTKAEKRAEANEVRRLRRKRHG